MMPRVLMWVGLLTVASAAAVLSFDSLRTLALVCGFAPTLAALLPVTVDAGAAVASLVWLGRWTPQPARRFARWLAMALLGGSVAGNALGHGLAAYSARPHWLVLVAVSAVAPAVLGAVVHLAVLATHAPEPAGPDTAGGGPAAGPDADQAERLREHIAATGTVPSGKEVRRLLGIGSGRAARLLAEVGPVPAGRNGDGPEVAR